ncbi:MAG TPA: hypothetical protein VHB98_04395 [Chloroflexota bacterium]|nr:hypothetical protein [Chloroflexota bacterium]
MAYPVQGMQQRTLAAKPRVLAVRHPTVTGPPRPRLPALWYALQAAGVLAAGALIAAGYMGAPAATTLFWHGFVLVAPLLFLIAPSVWRNVCPLATLNQLPRLLGIVAPRRLPAPLQRAAPFVSAGLLLVIVALRPFLLDRSAPALATFIAVLLGLALTGGLVFGGKSGWCTSFCPMLTIERFYGSNALIAAPHAHCRPCIGCVRNCRDVQPAASLIDLRQGNRQSSLRLAVAGALPWLGIAFFSQPAVAQASAAGVLFHTAWLLLFVASGSALSLLVRWLTRLTPYRVVALHVVAALHLYYWYSTPLALRAMGIDLPLPARLVLQLGLAILSLYWLRRVWRRERQYQAHRPVARVAPAAS